MTLVYFHPLRVTLVYFHPLRVTLVYFHPLRWRWFISTLQGWRMFISTLLGWRICLASATPGSSQGYTGISVYMAMASPHVSNTPMNRCPSGLHASFLSVPQQTPITVSCQSEGLNDVLLKRVCPWSVNERKEVEVEKDDKATKKAATCIMMKARATARPGQGWCDRGLQVRAQEKKLTLRDIVKCVQISWRKPTLASFACFHKFFDSSYVSRPVKPFSNSRGCFINTQMSGSWIVVRLR